MNILNIIDIPWNSGITAYALESSNGLAQKGHKISFAGIKNGHPLRLAREHRFETVQICSRKNPFVFGSILRLKKIIDSRGIELINAHTGSAYTLACLTAAVTARRVAVVRTNSSAQTPCKNFLYKYARKFIVASEFIKNKYVALGIPAEKLAVVYQGINKPDPAFLSGIPAGAQAAAGAGSQRIGIAARLDPVKGHKYFLETAALVLKRYPDIKFAVAGKEANITYSRLRRYAEEFGIADSVEFVGFAENIFEFMGSCTLGLITSMGSEAVSRVLLEWMVMGKPVVATSAGCIPEILDAEFIVPPGEPSVAAQKILELLDRPELLAAAGERNSGIIDAGFGFDKFIDVTEKLYYESLENIAY